MLQYLSDRSLRCRIQETSRKLLAAYTLNLLSFEPIQSKLLDMRAAGSAEFFVRAMLDIFEL